MGRQAVEECGDDPDLRVGCLLSLAEATDGRRLEAARATAKEALAIARNGEQARAEGGADRSWRNRSVDDAGRWPRDAARGTRARSRAAPSRSAGGTPRALWATPICSPTSSMRLARYSSRRARRAMDAGDEQGAEDIHRVLAQVEVRAGHLARAQRTRRGRDGDRRAGRAELERERPALRTSPRRRARGRRRSRARARRRAGSRWQRSSATRSMRSSITACSGSSSCRSAILAKPSLTSSRYRSVSTRLGIRSRVSPGRSCPTRTRSRR